MLTAIHEIVEMEVGIRGPWNKAAIDFKDDSTDDRARSRSAQAREEAEVSLGDADTAVKTSWMWAYAKMLLLIARVLEAIEFWFQSCPCHSSEDLGVSGMSAWFRSKAMSGDSNTTTCSSRGCRSAECADGYVLTILSRAFEVALGDVVTLTFDLIPDERDWVVSDFHKARAHIVYVITLKVSFWQSLPYKLCSLNVKDPVQARSNAQLVLMMWMSASDEVQHHGLTLLFLHPEGGTRRDIDRFIAGESLDALPNLARELAALRWVNCVERSVEGLHSRIHKASSNAANLSVPSVSFELCQPEIKELLDSQRGFLEFAELCSSVRSAKQIASQLGLLSHKNIQAHFDGKGILNRRVVALTVYRCDLESMYKSEAELEHLLKTYSTKTSKKDSSKQHVDLLHLDTYSKLIWKHAVVMSLTSLPKAPRKTPSKPSSFLMSPPNA